MDESRRHLLPELVRFACDPHLDAMTRTWIFDAVRDLSGQDFGDDPRLWRAWYTATSGQPLGSDRDASHALVPSTWLQN